MITSLELNYYYPSWEDSFCCMKFFIIKAVILFIIIGIIVRRIWVQNKTHPFLDLPPVLGDGFVGPAHFSPSLLLALSLSCCPTPQNYNNDTTTSANTNNADEGITTIITTSSPATGNLHDDDNNVFQENGAGYLPLLLSCLLSPSLPSSDDDEVKQNNTPSEKDATMTEAVQESEEADNENETGEPTSNNHQKERAAAARAASSKEFMDTEIFQNGCRHGADGVDCQEFERRYVGFLMWRLHVNKYLWNPATTNPKNPWDIQDPLYLTYLGNNYKWWTGSAGCLDIDKTTVIILKSMAAKCVLEGKYGDARCYIVLALQINVVINECAGDFSGLLTLPKAKKQELEAAIKKCRTDQGTQVEVGTRLPCNCLPKEWPEQQHQQQQLPTTTQQQQDQQQQPIGAGGVGEISLEALMRDLNTLEQQQIQSNKEKLEALILEYRLNHLFKTARTKDDIKELIETWMFDFHFCFFNEDNLELFRNGCRHGTDGIDLIEIEKRRIVIEEWYVKLPRDNVYMCDHTFEYWSWQIGCIYVDKTTEVLAWAMAADSALEEKYHRASHYLLLALWVNLAINECDGVFEEIRGLPRPMHEELLACHKKCRTYQGTKVQIGKRIPCNCLPKVWTGPRLATCGCCYRQLPKTALKKCGRCLIMDYCSPECSQRDWKRHKLQCKPKKEEEEDSCHHGGTGKFDKGWITIFSKIVDDCANWYEDMTPRAKAKIEERIKKVYSPPLYMPYLDSGGNSILIKDMHAHCAQSILEGEMYVAHRVFPLVLKFRCLEALCKDDTEKFVDTVRDMENTRADQQLLVYVHKAIPCQCLEQMKKEASEEGPKAICSYDRCPNPVEKSSKAMFQCSICNVHSYCSEQCQHDDWKEHKLHCRKIVKIQKKGARW